MLISRKLNKCIWNWFKQNELYQTIKGNLTIYFSVFKSCEVFGVIGVSSSSLGTGSTGFSGHSQCTLVIFIGLSHSCFFTSTLSWRSCNMNSNACFASSRVTFSLQTHFWWIFGSVEWYKKENYCENKVYTRAKRK